MSYYPSTKRSGHGSLDPSPSYPTPPTMAQEPYDDWSMATGAGNYTASSGATWPHDLQAAMSPFHHPSTTGMAPSDTITAPYPPDVRYAWPSALSRGHAMTTTVDCLPALGASNGLDMVQQGTAPMVPFTSNGSPNQYHNPQYPHHSSSFAASQSVPRTAGSPYIKLEDFHGQQESHFHVSPVVNAFDQPIVVSPGDIMASSDGRTEQPMPMFLPASSNSDEGDYQRWVGSADHHRAVAAQGSEDSPHKRSFTTPEEAVCRCELCDKPFKRPFNLKSHMQVHDTNRNRPHSCRYPDCSQRFARPADLSRHEQAVHEKSRPFVCGRCGNSFARKDTLTRHMTDGCPKRPQIKCRVFRPRRSPTARNASVHSSTSEAARRLSYQSSGYSGVAE